MLVPGPKKMIFPGPVKAVAPESEKMVVLGPKKMGNTAASYSVGLALSSFGRFR